LYLMTPPGSPALLIVGILLPPLFHILIAALKIPRIRLNPTALTLLFALALALWFFTTLLSFSHPPVGHKITAAIDTPLLLIF